MYGSQELCGSLLQKAEKFGIVEALVPKAVDYLCNLDPDDTEMAIAVKGLAPIDWLVSACGFKYRR